MKIQTFDPKYIDDMARLFAEAYSEPGSEWDTQTAKAYIERDYKECADYCLMALTDDNQIMGAVFCAVHPYYKSKFLLIDVLQVKKEFRNQGVAKKLLRSLVDIAKKDGFTGMHMLADERGDFPMGWYKRLGFKSTHWVECEADIDVVEKGLGE